MDMENNNEVKIINFKDFKILAILIGFVVITIAFGTLTVQKIIVVVGGLTTPGSSIWFSLIILPVMQIICSAYNKKFAHFAIFAGWVSMLVTTILAQITAIMPTAPVFQEHNETFNFLMTNSLRYFIVATFSYVTTNAFGNEFFSHIKFTKHLWLKSLIVTTASQFINTVILVFAMFAGTTSWNSLFAMFVGTITIRLCLVPIVVILVCLGSFIVEKLKDWSPHVNHEYIKHQPNQKKGVLRGIISSFF